MLEKLFINPLMPGGTKMYRQKAKNSNFSDVDDIWRSSYFFIWSSDEFMYKKLKKSAQ